MKKGTTATSDSLTYALWLVFARDGGARLLRSEPALYAGERAMRLSVTLPKTLFSEPPTLKAEIIIPQTDQPTWPVDVILQTGAEALSKALGMGVTLLVEPPAASLQQEPAHD